MKGCRGQLFEVSLVFLCWDGEPAFDPVSSLDNCLGLVCNSDQLSNDGGK